MVYRPPGRRLIDGVGADERVLLHKDMLRRRSAPDRRPIPDNTTPHLNEKVLADYCPGSCFLLLSSLMFYGELEEPRCGVRQRWVT